MKNRKLKKLLFGTSSPEDPWAKYEQIRLNRLAGDPSRVEDPNTALMRNNIMHANAMKDSNKDINTILDIAGSKALGSGLSILSKGIDEKLSGLLNETEMAYGGEKEGLVELEGGEIVERQNKIFDVSGPDHYNSKGKNTGGVKAFLEDGDVVRSKRIIKDGSSLADRGKKRFKTMSKLEKLLEKNETDALLKATHERTRDLNDMEADDDLKLQSIVNFLKGKGTEKDQRAWGTIDPKIFKILENLNSSITIGDGSSSDFHGENPYKSGSQPINDIDASLFGAQEIDYSNSGNKKFGPKEDTGEGYEIGKQIGTAKSYEDESEDEASIFNKLLEGGPTIGDAAALYGQFRGYRDPMRNTLEARAGDTPNINAFEDFGKDGLETIQSAKNFLEQNREDAEEDLTLRGRALVNRGRNSARGINTMRALDIAGNANVNQGMDKIRETFNSAMMQLLAQEANMENQQDKVVMSGEQQRDLADRQDRDNFFTQLGLDKAGQAEALQAIGKSLNSIKGRNDNEEMIENIIKNSKGSAFFKNLMKDILRINGIKVKDKTDKT